MTLAASTISDIVLNANEDDLDRIIQSVKDRRKVLTAARAAEVQIGMACTLRYFGDRPVNGLTGTVIRDPHGRSGQRAYACKLNEASTKRLRNYGGKFYVPADVTEYVLPGVPMQCFKVA